MDKNKAKAVKEKIDKILASKQAEIDVLMTTVNDLTNQLEEVKIQPKSKGIEMRLPEMIKLETPEEVTNAIDEIRTVLKNHVETLGAVLTEAKKGNAKEYPKEVKINNVDEFSKDLKINNFPEVQSVKIVDDQSKAKAMPKWVPEIFGNYFETLASILTNTLGKTVELLKKITWNTKVEQDLPFMVMIIDPKTGKPSSLQTYISNSYYGGGGSSSGTGGNVGVLDSTDVRVNPMTNEKGDEIVTAIENIVVPAPVGGATEAKQDAEIAEIQNVANEVIQTKEAISNKDIMVTLKELIKSITYPAWFDRSANAIRNQVQSGTISTVTTVTTVTTVAGITNLDGYQAKLQVINQNNGAWAQIVRARIS